MCEARGGRRNSCKINKLNSTLPLNAVSTHLIHAWYMKHAFQELRGTWRCISFARSNKSKKKSAYQAQADMAKTISLQRASARAAASRNPNHNHHNNINNNNSNINLPTLGCTESSQWMFRSWNSLYTKKKSRSKDHRVARLKSLARSSSLDRVEDTISSSSLAELIPSCTTVDFDVGNMAMSPDSDYQTTGEPPSRRSSDSFLSPKNCDSSGVTSGPACPKSSPFLPGRTHRRKRSIFRAAKVALTGGRSNGAGVRRHVLPVFPISNGIGLGRSRYSLSSTSMSKTKSLRMLEKQHPTSPAPARLEKNLSRGTSITMDTSSSPCKSSSNVTGTSWMENYDMLTETLSTSSWSLRTDEDSPSEAATKLSDHSPRERELEREIESPLRDRSVDSQRERFVESQRERYVESQLERYVDNPRERQIESSHEGNSKLSTEEWRRVLHEDNQQDYYFEDSKKPSSPVTRPLTKRDLQRRQASAIKGARHTGKDFQEAIVDIILDNDVNDLVDLEEFLQNYFRLNTLYQDIIQQFFNDLSEDLVNPKVSRAPSVFARLAAANHKSMAAVKAGGKSRELDDVTFI
ncbi:unnamed protein product [Calypogeia fissa]